MKKIEFNIRKNKFIKWAVRLVVLLAFFLLIPKLYSLTANFGNLFSHRTDTVQFPVTVDPLNKRITEDKKVNEFLASPESPLEAAVVSAEGAVGNFFTLVATAISKLPFYRNLAYVGSNRIVTIQPGLRKEQVANAFAEALEWDAKEKKAFLSKSKGAELPLFEGSFYPGTYSVELGMTPETVQEMMNEKFEDEVLSHYGEDIAKVVPLNVALTVASMIQRETIGTDDMRMVSGIIWNRIFANMNLQLDATLQYAKASNGVSASWWPQVTPQDKYIKSPYNTYMNKGLPPAPIANPSTAAVLAALNPSKTDCIFYFHDNKRGFHCSATYAEHVAELKRVYGRGK